MLKISRVVLPLLLAGLLIAGLIAQSGLSLAQFLATLRKISLPAIGGILTCTALFLILSTVKWRLVMGHVASGDAAAPGWGLALYYTTLGAVLSLVITPHAALPLSRSLGAKLHLKGSAIIAAAASAYEQIFDVIPLVTMSLAALVAMAFEASFAGWLAIAVALNATAFATMLAMLRSRFWRLAAFVPLPRRSREMLLEKLEWFATPAAKTLLGPAFVGKLFVISLTRYGVLLARTSFVIGSVLPIGGFQFVKAYGVARLSSLVSITPGELGINEWTWSGVLVWMGFRLDDAARFVLANRLCNIAAVLAVFGIVWVAFSTSLLLCSGTVQDQHLRRTE